MGACNTKDAITLPTSPSNIKNKISTSQQSSNDRPTSAALQTQSTTTTSNISPSKTILFGENITRYYSTNKSASHSQCPSKITSFGGNIARYYSPNKYINDLTNIKMLGGGRETDVTMICLKNQHVRQPNSTTQMEIDDDISNSDVEMEDMDNNKYTLSDISPSLFEHCIDGVNGMLFDDDIQQLKESAPDENHKYVINTHNNMNKAEYIKITIKKTGGMKITKLFEGDEQDVFSQTTTFFSHTGIIFKSNIELVEQPDMEVFIADNAAYNPSLHNSERKKMNEHALILTELQPMQFGRRGNASIETFQGYNKFTANHQKSAIPEAVEARIRLSAQTLVRAEMSTLFPNKRNRKNKKKKAAPRLADCVSEHSGDDDLYKDLLPGTYNRKPKYSCIQKLVRNVMLKYKLNQNELATSINGWDKGNVSFNVTSAWISSIMSSKGSLTTPKYGYVYGVLVAMNKTDGPLSQLRKSQQNNTKMKQKAKRISKTNAKTKTKTITKTKTKPNVASKLLSVFKRNTKLALFLARPQHLAIKQALEEAPEIVQHEIACKSYTDAVRWLQSQKHHRVPKKRTISARKAKTMIDSLAEVFLSYPSIWSVEQEISNFRVDVNVLSNVRKVVEELNILQYVDNGAIQCAMIAASTCSWLNFSFVKCLFVYRGDKVDNIDEQVSLLKRVCWSFHRAVSFAISNKTKISAVRDKWDVYLSILTLYFSDYRGIQINRMHNAIGILRTHIVSPDISARIGYIVTIHLIETCLNVTCDHKTNNKYAMGVINKTIVVDSVDTMVTGSTPLIEPSVCTKCNGRKTVLEHIRVQNAPDSVIVVLETGLNYKKIDMDLLQNITLIGNNGFRTLYKPSIFLCHVGSPPNHFNLSINIGDNWYLAESMSSSITKHAQPAIGSIHCMILNKISLDDLFEDRKPYFDISLCIFNIDLEKLTLIQFLKRALHIKRINTSLCEPEIFSIAKRALIAIQYNHLRQRQMVVIKDLIEDENEDIILDSMSSPADATTPICYTECWCDDLYTDIDEELISCENCGSTYHCNRCISSAYNIKAQKCIVCAFIAVLT